MKHFMLRCWSTEHEIRCDFSTLFHDNLSRLAVTAHRIPFPKQESKGWTKEVYNLDLILYLTYKLPSRNAQIFRKYMMNKTYERSLYEQICIIVDDVDFRHQSQSSKEE